MNLFDQHMKLQRSDQEDQIKKEVGLTFCDTSDRTSDSELSDVLVDPDADAE